MKAIEYCQKIVLESLWIVLFTLGCLALYEHTQKERDEEYNKLYAVYTDLQDQKRRALEKQEDMLLQINSQSDPAWVELTLMKVLGLTPEGSVKVYFTNEE